MTSQQREDDLPPPGSYQVAEQLDKVSSSLLCSDRFYTELNLSRLPSQQAGAVSVFKSSSKRFDENKNSAQEPGPGDYQLQSSLTKPRSSRPRQHVNKSLELIQSRPLSPPSIPARNQSYGYELQPGGQLSLQKPLIPGFSGKEGDAVGPGDYDPKPDIKFKATHAPSFKVNHLKIL